MSCEKCPETPHPENCCAFRELGEEPREGSPVRFPVGKPGELDDE